ncbi:MAG: twin-arginine translocase TatA/TatE family subunit [Actinobacteria bacterium]|nr:twin-arginine translocase TatA/TatE family subunit [Actinomycetota bacterium]
MPQVGPLEILVIVVVALLVFGPKEIPKVARQAAKGWREVQRFQATLRRDIDDVLREADEDDDRGNTPTPTPTLPPKAPATAELDAPKLEAAPQPSSDTTPPADPTP